MALGARPADVSWLVLAEGLRFASAGLAIGIALALASTRVMASLPVRRTPADPLTYTVVALALAAIALAATQIPARRATRVDPTAGLRER